MTELTYVWSPRNTSLYSSHPSSHVRREVNGVGSITQREATISLLTARQEEGHLLQWSETLNCDNVHEWMSGADGAGAGGLTVVGRSSIVRDCSKQPATACF